MKRFGLLCLFLLYAVSAKAQPASVLNSAGATLCADASKACPIAVSATGGIYLGSATSGHTEVTNITMGTVAFGSVGASYTAALTDSHNKLEILVDNQTDAAIYVSFNGTNNHEILAAGQAAKWNFGSYGRYESGNVSIKHTGAAPTSGNVYVSARY